jgi:uncharacterized protein (DUF779 family)
MVPRASATPAALELLRELKEKHGELILHQSGGCCDGSAPMCYPKSEFRIGHYDVFLADIEGTAYYIGGEQFVCWSHTHLELDVVKGRGASFSLEAPEGKRFIIQSRVFSEEEQKELENQPVLTGDQSELVAANA